MEGGCRSNGCSVEETIDGVMEKLDGEWRGRIWMKGVRKEYMNEGCRGRMSM